MENKKITFKKQNKSNSTAPKGNNGVQREYTDKYGNKLEQFDILASVNFILSDKISNFDAVRAYEHFLSRNIDLFQCQSELAIGFANLWSIIAASDGTHSIVTAYNMCMTDSLDMSKVGMIMTITNMFIDIVNARYSKYPNDIISTRNNLSCVRYKGVRLANVAFMLVNLIKRLPDYDWTSICRRFMKVGLQAFDKIDRKGNSATDDQFNTWVTQNFDMIVNNSDPCSTHDLVKMLITFGLRPKDWTEIA